MSVPQDAGRRLVVARNAGERPAVLSKELTGPSENTGCGRTIVMVTHDEDVAGHARRIIRLRDGRIVDDQAIARG